ncbi:MAG: LytTR family DNA-binding domain-containing protein, partial [Bacteroidota bacterium]
AVGPRAMPVVVFVTAYDEHALRAFEAEALDYLLKPIDGDRLRRALERAEARVRGQNRVREPVRFVIRSAGRVRFVDAADVVYVEAARDYVVLHTPAGSHLLRSTMDAVERDLHGEGFLRIHRSTLVRASRVCEVRPTGSGGVVTMRGGARFRVSRGRWNDTLAALKATGQRIG